MLAPTIPQMFLEVCERFADTPGKIAYARKRNHAWETISHVRLRDDVECLAMGLLHIGIEAGQRVGIVSENRIEWVEADFALVAIGAIDVPVFSTLTGQQIVQIFCDSEVCAVVVSNALQVAKIRSVQHLIPSLQTIVVMNSDVVLEDGMVGFADVMELGRRLNTAEDRRNRFMTMAQQVRPLDLLTVMYTSGTSGTPKGVMLSHRNLVENISAATDAFHLTDQDTLLSYLPMCHAYERMSGYYLAFACGATTYFAESIEAVPENMREVHPTVMTSVPRLFERMRLRIEQNIAKEQGFRKRIATWAFTVGSRVARGDGSWLDTQMMHLADALVFSRIRSRMGGRMRGFISGGAALHTEDGIFFRAIGIAIIEGYGLTETSPVLTLNRLGEEALGTVGKPLRNVEICIADDGEILARGPNVMMGYWRDEVATREAIEPDGWFHTGDIGEFDDQGRLIITGRKKDIIVTNGGKNIAPTLVEFALIRSPLLHQVILIGDGYDYCTALIVPERDTTIAWADGQKLSYECWDDLVRSPELHNAIQQELHELQAGFSKFERARKFCLVAEPFSIDNGMLTPTLKMRRKAIAEYYAIQIEAMYGR